MTGPVALPLRWRDRIDVCAVLADRSVRWVIRDLLEATDGDAGDWADEPGHSPLVVATHKYASTWTLDQARQMLGGPDPAEQLLHWMQQREITLEAVGYGNVVRIGTTEPVYSGRLYTVTAAADRLNNDPAIDTGMRRLFDLLQAQGWIVRRGTEYAASQSAIDAGLLAVRPRRLPHSGNPWPQIVLTPTGLAELHALLGGTDSTVLEQEPPR